MPRLRRRLIYEGQVQGVGFRMTACRLSTGFPIKGYVRNQDDGRVELIAEGDPEALASFFRAIQREFGDMIRDVQEIDDSSNEPLAGFAIRY